MEGSRASDAASSVLPWIDLGAPPASIGRHRAGQLGALRRFGGIVGGVLLGGFAGAAAVEMWPGAATWTLAAQAALFAACAVPTGLGSFVWDWWFFAWLDKASTVAVRRIALAQGRLHVERVTGTTFDVPLARVVVADRDVGDGWQQVTITRGTVSLLFYAPPMVASTIRNAPK